MQNMQNMQMVQKVQNMQNMQKTIGICSSYQVLSKLTRLLPMI